MKQELPCFDTLLQLAQEAPDELERLRADLSHKVINSAPAEQRPRLRGLQFQIDSRREIAKTPLAACIHLSRMMHQSFDQLRDALNYAEENYPGELFLEQSSTTETSIDIQYSEPASSADEKESIYSANILAFPGS